MKDVKINIRISEELRDKFKAKCSLKAINKSEWLRLQIEKFVKDDEK